MIQKLFISLAIAPIIALSINSFAPSAFAQSRNRNAIFVNRTGANLTSLQTAPANSRNWQKNLLTKDLISGSEITTVLMGNPDCRLDVKATFSNGSTIEDYNVDLCKNDIYTFTISALW